MTEIQGFCDETFAPLREAFEKCFKEHGDIGASFAVTKDGEYVADLWGGHLDQERTRPWLEDTIVNVYSSTKTMMALVALVLSDRGKLDLYAPVCRYWPEFAANGKELIEIRHLLSHTAGLPGLDKVIPEDDLYDWEKIVSLLEQQRPWWEPGTVSGYHAITQGIPRRRGSSQSDGTHSRPVFLRGDS
ncbi:MAG: serine hydrolase domain-containing protein [Candidatus Azotimanducaceae bacterium]